MQSQSIQRILLSLGMVVFVGALAAGATGAFFSDTETSTGNTFAAGAIDLQIDNSSYGFDWNNPAIPLEQATGVWGPNAANSWVVSDLTDELFFTFRDLKPGDYGEDTISIHVDNNDAYACMAFDLTATPDNGINEPEADAGDVTDGDGGELQNYLDFVFWYDDGDNVLEVGEETQIIQELSGLPGSVFTGGWLPIAEAGDEPLEGGSTQYIGKGWCFGEMEMTPVARDININTPPTAETTGFTCNGAGNHNVAQTDGITVDVAFHAVQSRNNAGFLCSTLPPLEGGEPPVVVEVGASLASYVAPLVCTDTVTGTESIQTAVNGAIADSTICVDPTYDMTGDNAAILINTAGITLAATVRGVDLDVPVTISASNVTVTGFDGTIGQAASPAEQAAFYVQGDGDLFEISFNTVTGGVGAAILTETGGALGGGLIANNVLSGATQGIYTNPHTGVFTIEYNDIDDNVAGIGGLMGAIVRNNEFEHAGAAQEAIGVDSTNDANPATVTMNNFLDDTRVNTYGPIAGDLSADNNFWSPNGGAAQTGGTDEVDFTPEAGVIFVHN